MPVHFSLWRVLSMLSVMLLVCITLHAQAAPQVTAKTASTLPPYLSILTLSSTDIIGGSGATGTVTLSRPAPARGIIVALHSNNSAATVPATCTIAAGATQTTFRIKTAAVSASTTATLSGAYNGWAQGSWLSVLPSDPPWRP